jgi:hypothetical protein
LLKRRSTTPFVRWTTADCEAANSNPCEEAGDACPAYASPGDIVMTDSTIVSEILAAFVAEIKRDPSLPRDLTDAVERSAEAGSLGSADTVRAIAALSRQVRRED